MKENILPEEKLLRLIRKDSKKQAVSAPDTASEKAAAVGSALKQKYVSFLNARAGVLVFFVLSCIYSLSAAAYPLLAK